MSGDGKRRTILIVEDDQKTREMLEQVLSLEGFAIQSAKEGRAAITLMESSQVIPRIMLLDLVMPVLDGWGVVRWLVEHPEVKAKTKVVLMSANEKLQQASDLEHDGELPKPIDIDVMLAMLNSLM
jgi:CheY-like chemotaxis protein